jgi:hypothetical protein
LGIGELRKGACGSEPACLPGRAANSKAGFLFKLLQIKSIAFAKHFPVDIAQIVAQAYAMLGKFVREAAVGAVV